VSSFGFRLEFQVENEGANGPFLGVFRIGVPFGGFASPLVNFLTAFSNIRILVLVGPRKLAGTKQGQAALATAGVY
jgi:hypothetical protein